MADEPTTTDATATTAESSTPKTNEPAAATSTADVAGQATDALGDAGLKALQAERDAHKAADKARKDAEKALADARKTIEAFESEKLSETERLQKQADDNAAAALAATEALKSANLRAEVAFEATKHGIDAKAAAKLIADEVEYDEATPTNVTDLVAGLVESGVLASKVTLPSSGLSANAQGGVVPEQQDTGPQIGNHDPWSRAQGGGVVRAE